jgi:hypothetical protein
MRTLPFHSLPVFIAVLLAAPAFARAQTLPPECKAPVDQTWSDVHKGEPSSESYRGVFRNALVQLLNPIVTRSCFDGQAHAIGVSIPRAENPSATTAEQARRRIQDASAAYIALGQCSSVTSYRADLIGSILNARSSQEFGVRFAKMYPGYVSRVMHCEAFNRYLAASPIEGAAYSSPRTRPRLLDLAWSISSPAAACHVSPGAPCTVPLDTSVALVLANALSGTSVVSVARQLEISGASVAPIVPTAGDQSLQVLVDTPGAYLLTVLLSKVKPKVPAYSVSLAESCTDKSDIVYFRDPVSKLGQVELEVH